MLPANSIVGFYDVQYLMEKPTDEVGFFRVQIDINVFYKLMQSFFTAVIGCAWTSPKYIR